MRHGKRRYNIEALEGRRLLSSVLTVVEPGASSTGPIALDASPPEGAHESETTVAVDPTNPLDIAALSTSFPTQSDKGLGTSYGIDEWWSTDGGASWQGQTFPYFDNASIAYDAKGNLFISSLAGSYPLYVIVRESTNKGASFTTVGEITGSASLDKDWLTTGPDPSNTAGNGLAVYVGYMVNSVVHVAGWEESSSGTISGSPSVDDAIPDGLGYAYGNWADPVVGPNGELYVAWTNYLNQIFISRALTGLWSSSTPFDSAPQTFTVRRSFLYNTVPADPSRGIYTGLTMGVDTDPASAYDGQLYMAYVDELPPPHSTFSLSNPETVIDLLRTSDPDDPSPTWKSTQIDPATDASEFMPALSVDPATGVVNVLYYSSESTGDISEVVPRLATSIDGGASWSLQDMSSTPSNMAAYDATGNDAAGGGNFDYGDYIDMQSYGGKALAVYSSTDDIGGVTYDGTTYGMGVHAYFATATYAPEVTSAANFTLALSAGGANLNITGSSGIVFSAPIASVGRIQGQVAGVLTIDPTNGNPVPAGGLNDNGLGTGTLEIEVYSNSDISSLSSASLGLLGNPVDYANLASLTLDIDAGTFAPAFDVGGAGAPVTINDNADVSFPAGFDQHLAALNIASGAVASMTTVVMPYLPTLYLASLSIATDGSGNPLGTLDLGKSQMLLSYGANPDPMPTVFKYLQSGYASGAWNGRGIITSAGAANTKHNTVIGYADHDDGHGGATINPTGSSILLRYAVLGDANLSGTVDINDYNAVIRNFGATGASWDQGDVNYSGTVDIADYNAVIRNFGISLYGLTVAPQPAFAAGAGSRGFAIADVNGDGIPDLVLSDYSDNTIVVLLGNGNGTFQAGVSYAVGTNPTGIAVADVNGDGKPDVIVSNWTSANVSILLGNGDGTFKAQQKIEAGYHALSVAVGDLNGDGKPDIAMCNYNYGLNGNGDQGSITVLLGNGDGTFVRPTPFVPTLGQPSSVVIADMNGDGKPDIVYTSRKSTSVDVLLGNGDGTFPYYLQIATDLAPWSVAVADVNADGKPDLVVGDLNGTVSVILNNGNGTFLPQQTYAAGSGPFTSPTDQVVVADLNGDGAADLIVTDGNGDTISVLLGNGDGTFQAAQTLAVGNSPWAVQVTDINGDGKPDIVVINYADGTITVLLNTTTF